MISFKEAWCAQTKAVVYLFCYLHELDPLLNFPDYLPILGNLPENRPAVHGWVHTS